MTGLNMQRFNEKDGGDGILRTAGRAAPGVPCIALWLARNQALRNPFYDRRGRSSSMTLFKEKV